MEPFQLAATAICFAVGLSLGLLGGGGSVLMVPVFVYVAKLPVGEAIAMSLLIVGSSSAAAAVKYLRQGFVNKRLAILFVVPGIVASFLGGRAAGSLSPGHLLFMFGILMALISIVLFVKSSDTARADGPVVCRPSFALSVLAGSVIGFLTGLLGVGGGFLIVPAIALLMRCSLYTAIGTSLVIISMNSLVGFVGHLSVMRIDLPLTGIFLASTASGSFLGSKYSDKISTAALQKGFSILIFAVGCLLAAQHFPFK